MLWALGQRFTRGHSKKQVCFIDVIDIFGDSPGYWLRVSLREVHALATTLTSTEAASLCRFLRETPWPDLINLPTLQMVKSLRNAISLRNSFPSLSLWHP